MADRRKVVVLGAGVSGLTTAHVLSENNPSYEITIVAKHMPGDYDIEYASPWAGANMFPVSEDGSPQREYERQTWPELARLATDVKEAGMHFQDAYVYRRAKDAGTPVGEWFAQLVKEDAWFSKLLPNFRQLSSDELPPGCDSGNTFTSVCINTALYLPWLASQCLRKGVVIKRGVIHHISEAADFHHSGSKADVVVNCTGLGSFRLGGVEDRTMYPARGQIVVVRNETSVMAGTSGTDDGEDEALYIMGRAAGGGTILGGCLQKDNWDGQPDHNLALRIMQRCVELRPDLVAPGKGIEGLDVVRHGVGLRPGREGGIRLEKETIGNVQVVHNYGHAGYGYQTSYGCSIAVDRILKGMAPRAPRSRL